MNNDFKEKKIKDELYEIPSNYAGYVPLDAVVKYIIQRDNETRKETIDTCIQEVREHEIRNDDGNDYITEDTELMREEIVQTLLEIKDE